MVWVNLNHQDRPHLQGHPVNLDLAVELVSPKFHTIQVSRVAPLAELGHLVRKHRSGRSRKLWVQ